MDVNDSLFDRDVMANALKDSRELVDSASKFRRLMGDSFSKFGDDLAASTRSLNKLFDDAHSDHERFEKFAIKQREAESRLVNIGQQKVKLAERQQYLQDTINRRLNIQVDKAKEALEKQKASSKYDKATEDSLRATLKLKESALKEAERTANTLQDQRESLGVMESDMTAYVDKWKKAGVQLGIIQTGLKGLSKIPGVGQFFNTEEMLENMQKSTLEGKNFLKVLGSGIKALPRAIPWLAAIDLAVKGIKAIIGAMFDSDKYLTRISRQFATSKSDAADILSSYRRMIPVLNTQFASLENILSAQEELNSLTLRSNYSHANVLDAQIQMTKELNLSVDAASDLNKMFAINNEEGNTGLDNVRKSIREYMATNKVIVNTERVLQRISATTWDIRSRLKGGVAELTMAVLKADALGVSLEQSNNISQGLLDFESSITSELEAELLLNKSLNLEKARMNALNGDHLAATEDILAQLGGYDKLSKLNVLQQRSAAKLLGMQVPEMMEIAANQKYLVGQAAEFHRQLSDNVEVQQLFAKTLAMNNGDFDKTQKQIDAQTKLTQATQHMQDLFVSLFANGVLDKVATGIERIANGLVRIFGEDNNKVISDQIAAISELESKLKTTTGESRKAIQMELDNAKSLKKAAEDDAGNWSFRDHALSRLAGFDTNKDIARKNFKVNPPANDFIARGNTITPFRKDDLVIGGTNLGGDNKSTSELIRIVGELLAVVKTGSTINIDGRAVATAHVMNNIKSA